jgi:hypothetical protein
MLALDDIEELSRALAACDRQTLVEQLLIFASNFPVDFTPEYLSKLSSERLQHLFFALCLQNQRMPDFSNAA